MNKNLRLEWLDPKTLKPNPMNFRRHPEHQKKILSAMLSEVGWAGALLINETTGRIIDGHARQEEALLRGDAAVPVLVGSWSEAEEQKILATLDPIAAMAEQADEIYRDLLSGIETDSDDLKGWVDGLISELSEPIEESDNNLGDVPEPGSESKGVDLECCPKCGFEWKKT